MKQVINLKNFTMENVSSVILIIMGTVFLFLALWDAWMYFYIMAVCYAAAILVRDLKDEAKHNDKSA